MRGVPGSTPGCGTYARYQAGCDCDLCSHANTRRQKLADLNRRRGRTPWTDRTGTIRRIQALQWMGWRKEDIGRWLGCTPEAIYSLTKLPDSPILRATAEKVAAVYDEHCMIPGPSNLTRIHARKQGWLSPLAWDDIDDPDEHPHTGHQARPGGKAVYVEDVEDAISWGYTTTRQVAARLSVSEDAVHKACTRAGRYDLLDRLRKAVAS